VSPEPVSPELVLVDPDLAARARAALPATSSPLGFARAPLPAPSTPAPTAPREAAPRHPYPLWARATAAAWFVVLGILIGGAAIPHAQDTPRLIPLTEGITICKAKPQPRVAPLGPEVTTPGP
jgi:hypothetical protein